MSVRQVHRVSRSEQGFTLIELAIVILIIGILLVPLFGVALSSVESKRTQHTKVALEAARDALIAFAAANTGCLPFAADYEGGLPDTDQNGNVRPSFRDTGAGKKNSHAGDLPWADLGLTNSFLDGERLRLQYYVASPYTDNGRNPASGVTCNAGFRGFEWNSNVTYNGSDANPLYVYYKPPRSDRRLYKVVGTLAAGTSPDSAGPAIAKDVTDPLPASLLEVRRGPNVTGTKGQSDVVSAQNAFVLIALGGNRNATLGRGHVRDSNHVGDANGNQWPLNLNNVDTAIFSITPNVDLSDEGNSGDDTILVMSFINFKAELNKYGLNIAAICETTC